MVFVVCFVIAILHSVKAVICLFMQKTFTPEISLPKVQEFFVFHDEVMHPPLPICIVPGFVQVSWCACDVSGRTGYPRKKIRSAGFYISRIFNTQPLSRRDLLEGFYTCTKLSRFFFILQQKDDVHKYCIAKIHDYDVNVPFIIYTSVNYFSIPLVIFDRYIKQEEIF